jgi:transcriptional regulator with XRE-family HTH domain
MPRLTLGERVLLQRRRHGLTQSALAKAIGVSTPTIFRVEKGDFGDLKGQTIARLARTLQVRADYLLGLTDDDSEWTPDDDDDAHAA